MEDRIVEVRCLELFFARRTRPLLNRTIVHTGGGCLPTVHERLGPHAQRMEELTIQ